MNKARMFAIASAAGVIALAGCATIEEETVDALGKTYHATLTGAQEPGGGDPDGAGEAEISISDDFGQVCWEVKNIRNIATPTAAHIHMGAPGVNGPVVFTLKKSNEGSWQGCTDGSEWTQNRIQGNPGAFYVNVHNADYPNGAIRGQLHD